MAQSSGVVGILGQLFYMLVFPGFLFLIVLGLAAQFVDRKLYARMQNRQGPPWFQPLADLIKLAAKEQIVPVHADSWMFRLVPLFAMTAILTSFLYIPIYRIDGKGAFPFAFTGDLIVVLYLLTIPTITFFLGGWYSRSVYSMLGAVRALMQLFAYEVPLFLAILAPAILASSADPAEHAWSVTAMARFYNAHPALALLNVVGLCVALVAMLGKLERVPFDTPEAETEIVGGSFTEYTGRLYALFRLAVDIEAIVGASLIAAVFLPWGF
ncbi:MAG: NADH-quinone oxidoreductase subunit H, partial [Phycisphaerae bacterium]|nr:NADH-quinone oxidoreductase subunit H [Phycisphaerae bacterium]